MKHLLHKLQTANQEEQAVRSEYERIRRGINSKTSQATSKDLTGMTTEDVVRILGKPRVSDSCAGMAHYNYGKVWLFFVSDVFRCYISSKDYRGRCSSC